MRGFPTDGCTGLVPLLKCFMSNMIFLTSKSMKLTFLTIKKNHYACTPHKDVALDPTGTLCGPRDTRSDLLLFQFNLLINFLLTTLLFIHIL